MYIVGAVFTVLGIIAILVAIRLMNNIKEKYFITEGTVVESWADHKKYSSNGRRYTMYRHKIAFEYKEETKEIVENYCVSVQKPNGKKEKVWVNKSNPEDVKTDALFEGKLFTVFGILLCAVGIIVTVINIVNM